MSFAKTLLRLKATLAELTALVAELEFDYDQETIGVPDVAAAAPVVPKSEEPGGPMQWEIVLGAFGDQPTHALWLAQKTGLAKQTVSAVLTQLVARGEIDWVGEWRPPGSAGHPFKTYRRRKQRTSERVRPPRPATVLVKEPVEPKPVAPSARVQVQRVVPPVQVRRHAPSQLVGARAHKPEPEPEYEIVPIPPAADYFGSSLGGTHRE